MRTHTHKHARAHALARAGRRSCGRRPTTTTSTSTPSAPVSATRGRDPGRRRDRRRDSRPAALPEGPSGPAPAAPPGRRPAVTRMAGLAFVWFAVVKPRNRRGQTAVTVVVNPPWSNRRGQTAVTDRTAVVKPPWSNRRNRANRRGQNAMVKPPRLREGLRPRRHAGSRPAGGAKRREPARRGRFQARRRLAAWAGPASGCEEESTLESRACRAGSRRAHRIRVPAVPQARAHDESRSPPPWSPSGRRRPSHPVREPSPRQRRQSVPW